jgi:hypothetical protein
MWKDVKKPDCKAEFGEGDVGPFVSDFFYEPFVSATIPQEFLPAFYMEIMLYNLDLLRTLHPFHRHKRY